MYRFKKCDDATQTDRQVWDKCWHTEGQEVKSHVLSCMGHQTGAYICESLQPTSYILPYSDILAVGGRSPRTLKRGLSHNCGCASSP
ncbi:hypothetical protein O3P69_015642 [Scylla paramamosain]|uniref:Uncharacterized protein n=1 Tax=Scylla paramamosain TaxID=85552 RepID=A0AAW0SCX6_SCYPA